MCWCVGEMCDGVLVRYALVVGEMCAGVLVRCVLVRCMLLRAFGNR